MNKKLMMLLAGLLACTAAVGCQDKPPEGGVRDLDAYDLAAYMRPVWESGYVYHETAMILRDEDGNIPPVTLMYDVESVVAVRNFGLDTLYEEGKDYAVEDGRLAILETGAIAQSLALEYDKYYFPEHTAANNLAAGGGGILKTEIENGSRGLTQWQISVTYTHKQTESPIGVPETRSDKFAKTLNKLKNGEKTSVVCLGDSISAGWSASGYQYCNVAPLCPPYFNLVTDYLAMHYQNDNVDAPNFSVGGMMTDWGAAPKQIAAVAGERPDLVILAFGMNDGISNGLSTAAFKRNTLAIIDGVRAECPDAEFVLVASMLPNAEIANVLVNQYAFVGVLKQIAAEKENVAVADLASVSFRMLQRKKFRDISANNVNHPNDFMHRVYAQTVVKTIADIL